MLQTEKEVAYVLTRGLTVTVDPSAEAYMTMIKALAMVSLKPKAVYW